ncbi:FtsX-like permease family protein [Veronia nyctiphanis]|nr:FtsX-like permease family protein [Veronia nyctiphanis]
MIALVGPRMPYWWRWELDLATFGLGLLLTLVVVFVAVLYPAMRTANFNINDILRDGTRGAVSKANTLASKRMLGVQLGLVSFLIMFGAIVVYVMVSFLSLNNVDEDKDVYRITLHEETKSIDKVSLFTLLGKLESQSAQNVIAAATLKSDEISTTAHDVQAPLEKPIRTRFVSGLKPDSLIAGQHFSRLNNESSEPVAIISASLAQDIFGSTDVVGNIIDIGPETQYDEGLIRRQVKVIGVAEDAHRGLQSDSDHEVYLPLLQAGDINWLRLYFRSDNLTAAMTLIQQGLKSLDEPVRIIDVFDLYKNSKVLFTVFVLSIGGIVAIGGFSLLMALIGIYGMANSQVNQARYEIGVRRALGSTDKQVIVMMINKNMRYVGWGMGVATAIFAALSFVGYRLFDDQIPVGMFVQSGFLTFLGLVAVVGLALYIPAKDVVKQEPAQTLRMD